MPVPRRFVRLRASRSVSFRRFGPRRFLFVRSDPNALFGKDGKLRPVVQPHEHATVGVRVRSLGRGPLPVHACRAKTRKNHARARRNVGDGADRGGGAAATEKTVAKAPTRSEAESTAVREAESTAVRSPARGSTVTAAVIVAVTSPITAATVGPSRFSSARGVPVFSFASGLRSPLDGDERRAGDDAAGVVHEPREMRVEEMDDAELGPRRPPGRHGDSPHAGRCSRRGSVGVGDGAEREV